MRALCDDRDADAELKHKLAETLWWVFVVADRLGIDIDEAYDDTMTRIRAELAAGVARTA